MSDESSKVKIITRAMHYCRKAGLTEEQIHALFEIGYFSAPASRRNHLACEGGLALHSVHVTENLLSLGVFEDDASAYRVGMLHDLVKAHIYAFDADKAEYVRKAAHYPGHGVASVFYAEDLGVALTNEERQAIIWHMGAFAVKDRDLNDAYDQAKLLFPRQVVLTHAADHLASAMEDCAEKKGGANG